MLQYSLVIARPSSIVDRKAAVISFSTRGVINGPVQMTLYAIGCLPSFPCRHCVKSANSAPRGKASLVIGSHKNVSEAERNVLPFFRPFCRAEWAGGTQSWGTQ